MLNQVLSVDEIFTSIQGESFYQGYPCVFVRLYGCNYCCSYCDTPQVNAPVLMTAQQVYDRIIELALPNEYHVCITGGEPLLQRDSLTELLRKLTKEKPYFEVSIETNGSIAVPKQWNTEEFDILYCFDVKMPSSGITVDWNVIETNIKNGFFHYPSEIKFVVSDVEDVKYAISAMDKIKSICDYYINSDFLLYGSHFYPQFIFSPVLDYDYMSAQLKFANWIAQYLIYNKVDAKLQLQLHKIIGVK